jgi:nucleoside-diphosphate-sugar epimerase
MVKPVEDAMKALIEAAVINKVKRIVVTSSLSSVAGRLFKKGVEPWYTEKDMAPTKGADAYTLGKLA